MRTVRKIPVQFLEHNKNVEQSSFPNWRLLTVFEPVFSRERDQQAISELKRQGIGKTEIMIKFSFYGKVDFKACLMVNSGLKCKM